MGQRIDVVVLIGPVIFVLEFKVGESEFKAHAFDQVWDYALDLKNFHETSHNTIIAPILIATKTENFFSMISTSPDNDRIFFPITSSPEYIEEVIRKIQTK